MIDAQNGTVRYATPVNASTIFSPSGQSASSLTNAGNGSVIATIHGQILRSNNAQGDAVIRITVPPASSPRASISSTRGVLLSFFVNPVWQFCIDPQSSVGNTVMIPTNWTLVKAATYLPQSNQIVLAGTATYQENIVGTLTQGGQCFIAFFSLSGLYGGVTVPLRLEFFGYVSRDNGVNLIVPVPQINNNNNNSTNTNNNYNYNYNNNFPNITSLAFGATLNRGLPSDSESDQYQYSGILQTGDLGSSNYCGGNFTDFKVTCVNGQCVEWCLPFPPNNQKTSQSIDCLPNGDGTQLTNADRILIISIFTVFGGCLCIVSTIVFLLFRYRSKSYKLLGLDARKGIFPKSEGEED